MGLFFAWKHRHHTNALQWNQTWSISKHQGTIFLRDKGCLLLTSMGTYLRSKLSLRSMTWRLSVPDTLGRPDQKDLTLFRALATATGKVKRRYFPGHLYLVLIPVQLRVKSWYQQSPGVSVPQRKQGEFTQTTTVV